jgi:hypothetical protein
MNRYDKPLITPSKQSIIPAMHVDGRVIGFYPVASTTFTGTETTYTTSDGVEVPLKVVTVDTNVHLRTVLQYVAAVFEPQYAIQNVPTHTYVVQRPEEPWASADLIIGDPTRQSWYSLPAQTWFHRFNAGTYIYATMHNLDIDIDPPTPPTPPDGEDATMEWRASIDYAALFGDCSFFDFNWMTTFKTKSTTEPLRIVVKENPAPTAPETISPLVAKVIGIPTATTNGVIYDTIRILKLADSLEKKDYVFKFEIVDTKDLKTEVTFTLTVL